MAGIFTDPAVVDAPDRQRIEMGFEPLEDGGTFVTIAEYGWREDERGRKASYCMKAYVEYGINLREGFYPSEMRGELPPRTAGDVSGGGGLSARRRS
jgi:hypothetical protein